MTPQLWTPPEPRIIAPHVYPVEIVERHAAPALGIGVGIGFPRFGGSSPHPALAYGNAIAVWSLLDPSYYELNGSDVAARYNVLSPGTYDLTQGTATYQPALALTGWDSSAPVDQYAAADSLTVDVPLSGLQPFSLVLAAHITEAIPASPHTLVRLNDSGGGLHMLRYRTSGWGHSRYDGVTFTEDYSGTPDNGRNIVGMTFDGTNLRTWINGSDISGAVSVPLTLSGTVTLSVGYITTSFVGDIGDVWLYDEALGASAMAGIASAMQGLGYA